jgi:hypothetical protein
MLNRISPAYGECIIEKRFAPKAQIPESIIVTWLSFESSLLLKLVIAIINAVNMYVTSPTVIITGTLVQVINIPRVNPTVRKIVRLSPFFNVKASIIMEIIDSTIFSVMGF